MVLHRFAEPGEHAFRHDAVDTVGTIGIIQSKHTAGSADADAVKKITKKAPHSPTLTVIT